MKACVNGSYVSHTTLDRSCQVLHAPWPEPCISSHLHSSGIKPSNRISGITFIHTQASLIRACGMFMTMFLLGFLCHMQEEEEEEGEEKEEVKGAGSLWQQ